MSVRKADGSLRLCIDYRGLHEGTMPEAYPLPRVDDILAEIESTRKRFTTITSYPTAAI
jgi:hypothetical protein